MALQSAEQSRGTDVRKPNRAKKAIAKQKGRHKAGLF
jgi:hypothetical protein